MQLPRVALSVCAANKLFKLLRNSVPKVSFPLATSRVLLVAALIIQKNGKTEIIEQIVKNIYVGISLL